MFLLYIIVQEEGYDRWSINTDLGGSYGILPRFSNIFVCVHNRDCTSNKYTRVIEIIETRIMKQAFFTL